MMDKQGYKELVLHPAPLNLCTLFLLPLVFKKEWMMKGSQKMNRAIFWVENTFYIPTMLLWELYLIPIVYTKIIIGIIHTRSFWVITCLLPVWVILGFFFLLYGVGQDMYYFIKTLSYNSNTEEDKSLNRQEEDFKEDKITILQELVDVLQAVRYLYLKKRKTHK